MEHKKTFNERTFETDYGLMTIQGPLSAAQLSEYSFHEDLNAFRPPAKQFEALKSIAEFEEGRIIVATHEQMIVGYVTYLHPDPMERWSEGNMDNLIELGAIEVVPQFRGFRVGSRILELSMLDPFMENYIIISTEYYWHWDLKGTKLSIWDYRRVMEKMMGAGGLTPSPTDDPEIISHPANCLMVRIGENVPQSSIEQFDELRFLTRNQYRKVKGE
ncbi:acetoin utilization protein AcuA [Halobacillus andaensis]|uniref:Acetoin utilization protein AcuA n=1 Tax=Halobacillus andaensis TaxID=1176239 RepID=A0A917AY45_HALAA|nr:GNAT family N-acetyltransferase [Halobacillus andaensis]MBP2002824.1 acetoin utilization protein AcuA [Halobacillus andaensis]GGF05980.1 acetoin utilization protein AcuA [Halobacillus andaensis]